MGKYRLTKKGKVVVVLLCSFMVLSVTLGVSFSKEKTIGNGASKSNIAQNKSNNNSEPQPPVSLQPQKGQAELNAEELDKLKFSIFYDANAVSFSNNYDKELSSFIEAAAQYENAKIQIEGNCATIYDNKSKDQKSANYDLSLRRAQSVADYLKNKGINSDRFVVVANGSEKPLKDNSTPEGRKFNRRVDVFFLSK